MAWSQRPGIIPSVAILDTCGPMARRVEDVAMLFGEMVGYDALDVLSVERPKEDYAWPFASRYRSCALRFRDTHFSTMSIRKRAKSVEEALSVVRQAHPRHQGDEPANFTQPQMCSSMRRRCCLPSCDARTAAGQIHPDDPQDPGMVRPLRRGQSARHPGGKLTRYIEARAALERRRRTIDAALR